MLPNALEAVQLYHPALSKSTGVIVRIVFCSLNTPLAITDDPFLVQVYLGKGKPKAIHRNTVVETCSTVRLLNENFILSGGTTNKMAQIEFK